jgi:hypothetical protein
MRNHKTRHGTRKGARSAIRIVFCDGCSSDGEVFVHGYRSHPVRKQMQTRRGYFSGHTHHLMTLSRLSLWEAHPLQRLMTGSTGLPLRADVVRVHSPVV